MIKRLCNITILKIKNDRRNRIESTTAAALHDKGSIVAVLL